MKRTNDRPAFLPPVWLTLVVTGLGIYGTGTVYRALTGAQPAADGLIGLAVMLLAVLVLGTPLAMAWQMRRRSKRTRSARPRT